MVDFIKSFGLKSVENAAVEEAIISSMESCSGLTEKFSADNILFVFPSAQSAQRDYGVVSHQPSSNQGMAHRSSGERVELTINKEAMNIKMDDGPMHPFPPGHSFLPFHS